MTTPFNALANLDALVNTALEVQDTDMTETGTGGFDRVILDAGDYNIRFTEYVEYGKRTPMYQGKPTGRPPVLNVRLGFIIYGPNGIEVRNRSQIMGISNSEKAKFKQFFDRLNAKGDVKHAAQKLGQAFRVEVTKEVSKTTQKEYNAINYGSLKALPKFDPETGEAINVPEVKAEDVKLFLWANPTKETWDSLFIDGTNDKGESKNFIQEDILKAVDYHGSPLQALREGGIPAPQDLAPAAPATPSAPVAPTEPAAPVVDATPAAPVVQPAPVAPAAPTAPVAPAAPAAE